MITLLQCLNEPDSRSRPCIILSPEKFTANQRNAQRSTGPHVVRTEPFRKAMQPAKRLAPDQNEQPLPAIVLLSQARQDG
jgi:hypothetical protein